MHDVWCHACALQRMYMLVFACMHLCSSAQQHAMSSSRVESSDEPPKKRQRCTKNKDRNWHIAELERLTQRPCQCRGGGGTCFTQFKDSRVQLCELRMELKRMNPAECDLTLSNMYYGASELGIASSAHEDDRVSSSEHAQSNDSVGRVESEGSVLDGRVDSSSDSKREELQKKKCIRRKGRCVRKRRYGHRILGQTVCRRAMKNLLGCRTPLADGSRRSGGRWSGIADLSGHARMYHSYLRT